jgi:hypothetical protein
MTKIETHGDLVQAIRTVLEYNWKDEEEDYNQWREDNPGMDDQDHIFKTLEALDSWLGDH